MRQLKYHEKKLLRKVDFLQWKNENNQRELQVKLWRSSSACGRWKEAQASSCLAALADLTVVGVCR